jgi:hypothetical protein
LHKLSDFILTYRDKTGLRTKFTSEKDPEVERFLNEAEEIYVYEFKNEYQFKQYSQKFCYYFINLDPKIVFL